MTHISNIKTPITEQIAGRQQKLTSKNNVINVNKDKLNNVINVNSKYALDKQKFHPNTEKTQLAEEIAEYFNDTKNYACHLDIVNDIGATQARNLLHSVKAEIEEKKNSKTPVRNPAKYFVWKYKFVYKRLTKN